ncbi:hypothetical protein LCGC14_1133650 [marine sediment metagenome]|uniref:Uncharacterized protein n=1 Tax=marine sediment metagenome TaxID=412755 RepID=A0A0F9MNB1_9ZZZZ
MAIGIGMDDTPINWEAIFERMEAKKRFQEERHQQLLEAKEKAHAAIKEFLNGDKK